MRAWLRHPAAWWVMLVVGLLPLVSLVIQTVQDQLGANPAETLIRALGDWTLRGLCLTLAVTPVRTVMGWPELLRYRRMLGVLTFGYASLHLLGYAWFDMGFEWADIARDIAKRPFILVGFTAFVVMSALAATSFNRAIRWMGAQRWKALHRAVYAVAVLAIVHFWWMRSGKQNFAEVLVYAGVLASLLGWRVWRGSRRWSNQ
ncbi:protein-methionine-sulfoxide reductase heme-binding subunit MsrQ [Limnohabitans parvus]|uniref:Protein-methionine-sulfoxide reductase heme-binding subunit MsrQ n=1 Tax=Limnohabitans parvus II-B4 TaxID=1293052 RepID=A0A315E2J3_9BURK|nr:protein-methionine-sulfoxide reductase heme-binding subunit MsrQ [Limnohabitans parvus]PUE52023.1 sulfoxide reductase heme-binding subunit YedZ [Limnohabitans parvus II-B4]